MIRFSGDIRRDFDKATAEISKLKDRILGYQEKISNLYKDQENWNKICLRNIANSGFFSSDRTIEDYNRDIWHLNKVGI